MNEQTRKPSSTDIVRLLEESAIFEGLGDGELSMISGASFRAVFTPGEFLFREGDPADKIYTIVDGSAAVEVGLVGRQRQRSATIAVVKRGESTGLSAGLGSRKYLASAYALEKTTVVATSGKALHRVYAADPSSGVIVLKKLLAQARSRLSATTGILAEMLTTAAHDLKADLAAVQALHQVVLGGYAGETTERQQALLKRAVERIAGLVTKVDEIFEMPRIEPSMLKLEPLQPDEAARASIEKAEPGAVEKRIEIELRAELGLPAIRADRALLGHALDSLLQNAVRFTPEGGRIVLGITEDKANGSVVFQVEDDGVGVDPAELSRIFDDFFRGKDAPMGGTGLGLSNARRIIEAHGGRIWAESPSPGSGKGTRFTFTLPGAGAEPKNRDREETSGHESGN